MKRFIKKLMRKYSSNGYKARYVYKKYDEILKIYSTDGLTDLYNNCSEESAEFLCAWYYRYTQRLFNLYVKYELRNEEESN